MKTFYIYLTALFTVPAVLLAQDIEEITVSSAFLDGDVSSINNPIHVIHYSDFSRKGVSTLAESIDTLLGISNQDYGASVGQPIIRGLSGNRVKVLNNGLVVRDVAFMGADHPIEVDIGGIQQIEIVKGPSSILYSNGAIGGIVNIVDNTISKEDVLENVFNLGFESQSVNDGDNYNIDYSGAVEGFNLFFSHSSKNLDNFDIPDEAVIHEPGEIHEEFSYLPNSDSKLAATRLGISKTGDWGYYGISSVIIDQLNGVPFHGEEEEATNGEPEPHEDERIFAVTDSSVVNIEGEYLLNGAINSIAYSLRETDSSLTEQHYEDPNEVHDPNEPEEHGATTFTNNSEEAQVILDISNANNEQKLAFNLANSDASVVKEVGTPSMRPAETSESTIGYFLGTNFNELHMDLGIRYDQINVKGSKQTINNGNSITNYDLDFDNLSFSASFNRAISDNFEATLGISNVERAPSSTELLMNGKHMAIQRFELGSVDLDSEEASNIDLELSYELNDIKFNLLYFQNDIDNYIYLQDNANGAKLEGVVIANHSQKDAEFDGYEFSVSSDFDLYDGNLAVMIGTDSVDGKFTDGTNIPRITPSRNIYSFVYTQDDLSVDLSLKEVKSQNDTAAGEEATAGFELLDLMVSKSYSIYSDDDLTLSLFGTNLFNEIARNHASYVKNEVPLAGRNLGFRFNLSL
tara:strand:+ start:4765 stop:6834 length:2070 start_codon:yes stop_codon:yes gene_type:complete